MNAYEKSLSLGLIGKDAEIVAALKASGLTHAPIALSDLTILLNRRFMMRKVDGNDGAEKWQGTLFAIKRYLQAASAVPEDEKPTPTQVVLAAYLNGFDQWFSHVTDPRRDIFDTTEIAYASTFNAMASQFGGMPGMPTVEDFEAVVALGGGWVFDDLTPEQFEADREQYQTAQIARTAYALIQSRRQAWDTLAAQIRSGIESGELVDAAAVIVAVGKGV